ncbi:hypothetical protein [Palleronia abyssalis]|uniref:Uncharacterized protein n=1 Tax=Palleronia abyssalis TaxID=1501240 RepID=A0A2R8BW84_9RHOB|nr:hypothetical protein [Palleronia abyssalis]SPJ24429.1 hypothetical protein PAA8504_02259 [Palleronia abyssalis]
MSDDRSWIATVWDKMNPSEPSPFFLMKLMAFMIGCFVFALVVGNYT